jgi:uncharacterized protein (TIGR02421 family)
VSTNQSTETYKQTIRELSDRIVEAQRPIRILNAIKWDAEVQEAFFAAACREQPPINRAYYERQPLGFDADAKRSEFFGIEHDIQRTLGQFSPVGNIMRRMCREYEMTVRMLQARGTPEFSRLSRELYGSPREVFHAGDPTLADLGVMLSEVLTNVDRSLVIPNEERSITGEEAVELVRARLSNVYPDLDGKVRVVVSDGVVADAAAGADYIKIRREARFNERDIKLLVVHEGLVHLGTTLNGLSQPFCTFLSKGPPSSTITQEGLAMLMEVLSFASYPARVRRVTNRIRAVDLAEQGATFVDVFNFFRDQGFADADSYINTTRVFRGSTPTAGPFTKDICYSKGFILVYNYIMLAIRRGLLDRIPLLFCGKATLEDMRTLAQLVTEGIVSPPKYLPPPIADVSALTAWMCYANFLSRLNLTRIEADYANIL